MGLSMKDKGPQVNISLTCTYIHTQWLGWCCHSSSEQRYSNKIDFLLMKGICERRRMNAVQRILNSVIFCIGFGWVPMDFRIYLTYGRYYGDMKLNGSKKPIWIDCVIDPRVLRRPAVISFQCSFKNTILYCCWNKNHLLYALYITQ